MGQKTKRRASLLPELAEDWTVADVGGLELTLEPHDSGEMVVTLDGVIIAGPLPNEKALAIFLTVKRASTSPCDKETPSDDQSIVNLAPIVAIDSEVAALSEGAALPPMHPGEILLHEFIGPHGLSPIRTAKRMGVPRTRVERLIAGQTAITEDTALRLERLFGASAEFWMSLQTQYALEVARRRRDSSIRNIEPLASPPPG